MVRALQQSRKVVTISLQSPVPCPGAAPSPAEFSSLRVSDDSPFIRTETLGSGMSLSSASQALSSEPALLCHREHLVAPNNSFPFLLESAGAVSFAFKDPS